VKINCPIQNVLDSAGGNPLKKFQRGEPHLEIPVFTGVSALESIWVTFFKPVLDSCGTIHGLAGGGLKNVAKAGTTVVRSQIKNNNQTVNEVLKTRKGSILQAERPPGTPGWDDIRSLTMAEVLKRSQQGVPGFRTIWKLLRNL